MRPFSHVYLIVLENKSEHDIIGSPDAPYLNSLIEQYGLANDYQGVAHPSQPNYLAVFSGSTQEVFDDEVHDVSAPNIADQLETAGRTWRVFAENLPAGPCFTGASAIGWAGRPGTVRTQAQPRGELRLDQRIACPLREHPAARGV